MSEHTLTNMLCALVEALSYQIDRDLLVGDLHAIHQRMLRLEQDEAAKGVKLLIMSANFPTGRV